MNSRNQTSGCVSHGQHAWLKPQPAVGPSSGFLQTTDCVCHDPIRNHPHSAMTLCHKIAPHLVNDILESLIRKRACVWYRHAVALRLGRGGGSVLLSVGEHIRTAADETLTGIADFRTVLHSFLQIRWMSDIFGIFVRISTEIAWLLRDFRLLPWCKWGLRSSGSLHGLNW